MSPAIRAAGGAWHDRTGYGILVTMRTHTRPHATMHAHPHPQVRTGECPECLGSGLAPNRKDFCPRCGGIGQVPRAA
ncbi:Zn-finger nucleic acid-binding protein [Actinokineospora baliensis]|nr:Zn-finger nucleic acid-binding protein [Actinokineospora baliensis]